MLGKRNREQPKLRKPPDHKANLYGCEMQWTENQLLSNITISTNLTHEEFAHLKYDVYTWRARTDLQGEEGGLDGKQYPTRSQRSPQEGANTLCNQYKKREYQSNLSQKTTVIVQWPIRNSNPQLHNPQKILDPPWNFWWTPEHDYVSVTI